MYQKIADACIVYKRAIGLLKQIWDEISFVGVMESRDVEFELL